MSFISQLAYRDTPQMDAFGRLRVSSQYREFPLVYTALGGVQDTAVILAAGIGGTSTAVSAVNWREFR